MFSSVLLLVSLMVLGSLQLPLESERVADTETKGAYMLKDFTKTLINLAASTAKEDTKVTEVETGENQNNQIAPNMGAMQVSIVGPHIEVVK